jgi:hypothetical protein
VLESTVAYDSHDVEYLFENYTLEGDPAHNSGWLSFPEGVYPTWTDTYLQPETEYCYHVRARDTSPNQNRTNWSDLACTTTPPEPDKNPPTPNPMDWDYTIMDVNGYAIDGTPHQIYLGSDYPWGHYVTMRADPTTVDPEGNGLEFYFNCTNNDGYDSQWLAFDAPPYIYTRYVGLWGQELYFKVKARDRSPNQNETAWSDERIMPIP